MVDLQQFKLVVGTANNFIYEDPVLGANGTAVTTKINALIDALQTTQGTLPDLTVKGSLITANTALETIEFPPGSDSYCLVADSSSDSGLSYEERVDLTSDQSIGGLKTFTQDLQVGGALTVTGDITGNNLSGVNTGDEQLASTLVSGTVKTNTDEADPLVYTKAEVDTTFIPQSEKAAPEGVATLGVDGIVPQEQLPPIPPIKAHVELIGDGTNTEYQVTHSFGVYDVVVQMMDVSTHETVYADVRRSDVNTVVVSTAQPVPTDSIKVMIIALGV